MKLLAIETDLRLCRELFAALRIAHPEIDVHSTTDWRSAFSQFQQLRPEVVLIDVAVGHRKGFDLCRRLLAWNEHSAVVLHGSLHTDACLALDAGAADYLLRPLELERVVSALRKAACLALGTYSEQLRVAEQREVDSYVAARLHGSVKIIPVREVHLFKAEDKYVTAIHRNGEDLIDEPLWKLEQRFGDDAFIRIHRNGLVARTAIRGLRCVGRHQHAVLLNDGQELRVSRKHLAPIRQYLMDRSHARHH